MSLVQLQTQGPIGPNTQIYPVLDAHVKCAPIFIKSEPSMLSVIPALKIMKMLQQRDFTHTSLLDFLVCIIMGSFRNNFFTSLFYLSFRLPRKTDMERKIEIYNFSARTRQLFVRLLALVKWANSASKVDKSSVSFLFQL